MRRILATIVLSLSALLVVQPASASTTLDFEAKFRETFGRSEAPNGVGFIKDFGRATETFTVTNFEELGNRCARFEGITVMTLVSDGSTLTTEDSAISCYPGVSAETFGSIEKSFGNPHNAEGTFEIVDGTGVFEGAEGSGTIVGNDAGDVLNVAYSGTITLP